MCELHSLSSDCDVINICGITTPLQLAGGQWNQKHSENWAQTDARALTKGQRKNSFFSEEDDRMGLHLLILDELQHWSADNDWRRLMQQEGRGPWIRDGLAMHVVLRVCVSDQHMPVVQWVCKLCDGWLLPCRNSPFSPSEDRKIQLSCHIPTRETLD